MVKEVRVIVLEAEGDISSRIIRLHQGWIVRFVRGVSLLGHEIKVVTSLFGEVLWSNDTDESGSYADIECRKPGVFTYTVTEETQQSVKGYVQVLPELKINGKPFPLDAIICQTYIAKLLGPLSEWKSRLRVAKESKFTMVHFTPVQLLGCSNSSYSLADHLTLNPFFNDKGKTYSMDDLGKIVDDMEKDWGLLSIQDVVWNHAAKNAVWLKEHPESSYNLKNNPHLRPAYVLDRLYYHFSNEIASGKWADRGVPPVIETDDHLSALRNILFTEIIPRIKLSEFFKVNIQRLVEEFRKKLTASPVASSHEEIDDHLEALPGCQWTRYGFTIDMALAIRKFNLSRYSSKTEEDRQCQCVDTFKRALKFVNSSQDAYVNEIIESGVNAVLGHVHYTRVDPFGPRRKNLRGDFPLVDCYFVNNLPSESWEKDELYSYNDSAAQYLMACNGWVMNANPLIDFASYPSEVYLRRELVCWGDCVKLNYGDGPEHAPFLWNYMRQYSQTCARLFHGVRIDNCHSTPMVVGEYMLKAAREIRPNLYVIAELFTGSEDVDSLFVNHLGITSLIREAQNAPDSHEQGRLVYRFGGDVVGAFIKKHTQEAAVSVAHALLYDQTHDNPSAIEKRSVYDVIPTAGMVAMASCANGSTRGYDELFPSKIDVVREQRTYLKWDEMSANKGIIDVRALINRLHVWMVINGFTQLFVDQMNPDIVAVTRHNPESHETVLLVAHTAFDKHAICYGEPAVRHACFEGNLDEIIFEAKLIKKENLSCETDENELKGLKDFSVEFREHIHPSDSKLVIVHGIENGHIQLNNFSSGSIVALKISPITSAANSFREIRSTLFLSNQALVEDMRAVLRRLSLKSFSYVFFNCIAEEIDCGGTPYEVPDIGHLIYCGLQGLQPILRKIRIQNDLGHPLCSNLRDGCWLIDFIVNRLKRQDATSQFGAIVERIFQPVKSVQYYVRPSYFEATFSFIYNICREELFKKLHGKMSKASRFVRALALSSISFTSAVNSAKLPPLSTSIVVEDSSPSSLCAGLPHFCVGIWRNWGRDTFIALPGCLLITGRYEDARNLILAYGGTLRHGLIPNLLAEGQAPRYNCRDAVWFWLYAISKYIHFAPHGSDILKMKVLRSYPTDDTPYGSDQTEEELWRTMQDALSRHFVGIDFRERNSGTQIDEHMTDSGFNVRAYVDHELGFICGGNEWNCGTWMDKMGSSRKAGNAGIPATPRDGSAVELQGLAYAVLNSLHNLHSKGLFPEPGVTSGHLKWTWKNWADEIKANFERCFYVSDEDQNRFVNRRGIVKDTYRSSAVYTDYQLRPNFAIALACAPKLMDPHKAWKALHIAEEALFGTNSIGIKTLDSKDWKYNGYFDPANDSSDREVAAGFNYHQGPEWLWVAAVFLRAKLCIAKELNQQIYKETAKRMQSVVGRYWKVLQDSPWSSLPELTNENGSHCAASCEAQAWSIGCLLETIDYLRYS